MAKALIFDYNGVLVDDVKWHVKAYRQVLEEAGVKLSDEEVVSRLGSPTSEVIRLALKDFEVEVDYKKLTEKKVELVNKWSKEAGVFFQETFEVMKELKKRFKLGLYTASLLSQMKEPPKEFFALFDELIAGDDVIEKKFKPKPHADGLLYIAKKFGFGSEECCYIGDLPVDIRAGKNAGMKAIGLETEACSEKTLKEAGADTVIKNLKELLELNL